MLFVGVKLDVATAIIELLVCPPVTPKYVTPDFRLSGSKRLNNFVYIVEIDGLLLYLGTDVVDNV
jgi:hypothetical protein